MLKLLYKPVAIVAGTVGGLLSGLIFNRVWKIVGRGPDVPAPMDSDRGWGEILLSRQVCTARYMRWSKRLSTAAPPSGHARRPESGQAVHSSNRTSRPTIANLKAPSIRPGDRGGAGAGHLQRPVEARSHMRVVARSPLRRVMTSTRKPGMVAAWMNERLTRFGFAA